MRRSNRARYKSAGHYKSESHCELERQCCAARAQSQTRRQLFNELRVYSTNGSSVLNLRNAPNPLPARRLQQMLGGEYHETCFCTCCPCRTWRGYLIQRGRICGADRRPDLDDGNRRAGRLRLQRMGPLLAPPLRRWRLLPSALLGWLRLAPSLGRLGLWRWLRLARALGWWLGLASPTSLAPVVITGKGASAPFPFSANAK